MNYFNIQFLSKMIYISDIFDELKLENSRLSNELLFANKCVMILFKFKDYLYQNYINKCHQTITQDLNDNQLKDLENELNCLMSEKNKTEINNELKSINNIKCNEQIEDTNCDKQMKGLTETQQKSSEMSLVDDCKLIKAIDDRGIKKNVEIANQLDITLDNVNVIYNKRKKSTNKHKIHNNSLVSEKQSRSTGKCNKVSITLTNTKNGLLKKAKISTSEEKMVTKFKCDWIDCDYYATTRRSLINHNNRHLGVRPFKCTVNGCDKSYGHKSMLESHVHFVHVLKKTIACQWPNCKSMFKTQKWLKVHMKTVHLTTYDQKPFKCDFTDCKFRALNKELLRIHSVVHSNEKPFKCEVDGCGKTFKLDVTLKAHMRTHRSEPHYKCDWPECGVAYRTWRSFKLHKMTKHENIDVNMYYCDWPGCDYKSNRKSLVDRHRAVHSDERKFSCTWPQCGKMMKSRNNLRDHLRIHMNDKKYKCQWPGCEYSCVLAGNLKKHFNIHCKKLQQ